MNIDVYFPPNDPYISKANDDKYLLSDSTNSNEVGDHRSLAQKTSCTSCITQLKILNNNALSPRSKVLMNSHKKSLRHRIINADDHKYLLSDSTNSNEVGDHRSLARKTSCTSCITPLKILNINSLSPRSKVLVNSLKKVFQHRIIKSPNKSKTDSYLLYKNEAIDSFMSSNSISFGGLSSFDHIDRFQCNKSIDVETDTVFTNSTDDNSDDHESHNGGEDAGSDYGESTIVSEDKKGDTSIYDELDDDDKGVEIAVDEIESVKSGVYQDDDDGSVRFDVNNVTATGSISASQLSEVNRRFRKAFSKLEEKSKKVRTVYVLTHVCDELDNDDKCVEMAVDENESVKSGVDQDDNKTNDEEQEDDSDDDDDDGFVRSDVNNVTATGSISESQLREVNRRFREAYSKLEEKSKKVKTVSWWDDKIRVKSAPTKKRIVSLVCNDFYLTQMKKIDKMIDKKLADATHTILNLQDGLCKVDEKISYSSSSGDSDTSDW